MFAKWIPTDRDTEREAYFYDTNQFKVDGVLVDYFEPEAYMNDEEDIEECETILQDDFNVIQTSYMHAIHDSKLFPEIDYERLIEFILDMKENYYANTGVRLQFEPKMIDSAFLHATRHDSPAEKSLSRGEFLDMLVRIAHLIYLRKKQKSGSPTTPDMFHKKGDPTPTSGLVKELGGNK